MIAVNRDGNSETAIRDCLVARYPRDSFTVTNKLTNTCFQAGADIRPFYENQLKWCGVDYFDFYLMHAQSRDIFAHFKECRAYETAPDFKKEGKNRTSAFPSTTPRMYRRRFLPSIRR